MTGSNLSGLSFVWLNFKTQSSCNDTVTMTDKINNRTEMQICDNIYNKHSDYAWNIRSRKSNMIGDKINNAAIMTAANL
jgi:hypothetical protein